MSGTRYPMTPRPGGMCLASLRRVGSPNTHDASGENPMVRTTNPECAELGHDWDEYTEPCACGRQHTLRICVRCLTPDDSETEPCEQTEPREDSPVADAADLIGGLPRPGKSIDLRIVLGTVDGGAVA